MYFDIFSKKTLHKMDYISCMNIHGCQLKWHGHIHDIVHDNVTIFSAKVHVYIANNNSKRSFQVIITKNMILGIETIFIF
jgi:hypothetical protein